NVFVLETMYWPDEIRSTDFENLDKSSKIRDQELQMARTLIENLTAPWNPDEYKDEYREALLEIVEKKAAGEQIEAVEAAPVSKVVDLMDALKASVEAVKKEPADQEKKPTRKKPAAPRKKAAAG